MIADHKNLQWYKDLVFPLVLALATIAVTPSVYLDQTLAAQIFAGNVTFLWLWIIGLFTSNAVTFVGVVLRKKKKQSYIWFEYPGSIVSAFSLLVYTGTILIGNPGGGALVVGVTVVIAFHYIINFLIIHFSVFSK